MGRPVVRVLIWFTSVCMTVSLPWALTLRAAEAMTAYPAALPLAWTVFWLPVYVKLVRSEELMRTLRRWQEQLGRPSTRWHTDLVLLFPQPGSDAAVVWATAAVRQKNEAA